MVRLPNLKGFRIAAFLCGKTLNGGFRVELYADDVPGVPLLDGQAPMRGATGNLAVRNDDRGTKVDYTFRGVTLVGGRSIAAPELHAALLAFEFPPLGIHNTNAAGDEPRVSAKNQTVLPDTDYLPADNSQRLWGSFAEGDAVAAALNGVLPAGVRKEPALVAAREDKPLLAAFHEPTAGGAVLVLGAKRNRENSWLDLLLRANTAVTLDFTLSVNGVPFEVTPAVAPVGCYEELFGRFAGLRVPTADDVLREARTGAAGGAVSRGWIETELSELLPALNTASGFTRPDLQPTQAPPQVFERLTIPFLAGPAVNLFAGF